MDTDKIIEELKNHEAELNYFQITYSDVINQLKKLEHGIVFSHLIKPCRKGDGIFVLEESKEKEFFEEYTNAALSGRLTKFVPASGAATRMFRAIESLINNTDTILFYKLREDSNLNPDAKSVYEFIINIRQFAFYDKLKQILSEGKIDPENLTDNDDVLIILKKLLDADGLNYSFYPKAAILFHKYNGETRTAFEEHIFEATELVADQSGRVKVHFTISEEHIYLIDDIRRNLKESNINDSIKLEISYSFQKKSTNTVSVTLDDKLLKDKNNKLLLRPAGHGALIENLNDISADIVLIKNIDNIVPSTKNKQVIRYEKLMTGFLISVQNRVFNYLKILESRNIDESLITEIKKYCTDVLSINIHNSFDFENSNKKIKYLFDKLNRPLRVCGMVKNEGHPGGGPFWIKNNDEVLIQIIEESQINKNDREQLEIFKASTHFNPVDMVCAITDYKGIKFNLKDFIDENSGLIAAKSYDGKKIKALELPGLWNGAMAYWNTVFVEIPSENFNPVKEINDLLKPSHKP